MKIPTTEGNQAKQGVDKNTLWKSSNILRGSMDPAEHKHVVMPLIFLKYVSDQFEQLRLELESQGDPLIDPEKPEEYTARRAFWVPKEARWSGLQAHAGRKTIGKAIDRAMAAIERKNPALRGVLPRDFSRATLDQERLSGVVNLIGNIDVGTEEARSADVLGQVYEYFLEQFSLAEGRKGGEFYTPKSVVQLLVNMTQPYSGTVYDPCCGSAGMFVQSAKFIEAHTQGNNRRADVGLSIYGQESNLTTWRLAKMNLAIRGIDARIEPGDSFTNDKHPDLRADYILANPPFNISEWNGEQLKGDERWVHGMPPVGNANFAWIQHFLHHLAPTGVAGFVLANGTTSSSTPREVGIRKNIVEADLVDCIVALPAQLFRSTQIPAALWFLSKGRSQRANHRSGETLFIDARYMGHMIDRAHRDLSAQDVDRIAGTYHAWQAGDEYLDQPGFCKSATLEDIRKHRHLLTPGRYVGPGLREEEEEEPFEEKMTRLTAKWLEQKAQAQELDLEIAANLERAGF